MQVNHLTFTVCNENLRAHWDNNVDCTSMAPFASKRIEKACEMLFKKGKPGTCYHDESIVAGAKLQASDRLGPHGLPPHQLINCSLCNREYHPHRFPHLQVGFL